MIIQVKFKFKDGRYYYRNYRYNSGSGADKARDYEFKTLRAEAEEDSRKMNVKIEDIFIING